jgi:GNAT superfamily N-acetyltransferase
VIRLAAADSERDVRALAALRRAWTAEDGPVGDDPGFEARFADWLARNRRILWLAESPEPIGMLNLAVFERMPRPGREPSYWGYIANTYVLPAHRNSGVGRALLDAALAHARAHRFARIVLAPSERSRPFYARAGFRPAESLFLLEL